MIELIFELANEVILVVIKGKKVTFGNTAYGSQMADISGLKLDYAGVCREFPDLELEDNWQEQACERFKEKIKAMKTEDEICNYVIDELQNQGYKAKKKQREGFRPINL
jgi:hypothetical protein|tara:strand:+ start:98 stop:424 length:327 start_codon:yes stop_codon:yes gene_type:complete